MGFSVIVEDKFEGPLDLMLHLIKENKLNLLDLDMSVLCDQYLHYINTLQSMHLEVASEFLSELASLIEYKSKKLLPKEKVEVEEEYEEDQKDKLVRRLLEYQKFKEVSEQFSETYQARQKLMSKPISEEATKLYTITREEDFSGDPYDLIKAMNRVLRRVALEQVEQTTMQTNEMSLDERLEQITKRLSKIDTKISFAHLCDDCHDVHMVIVSFLSILDLIKQGMIHFTLDTDDTIWIMNGGSVNA